MEIYVEGSSLHMKVFFLQVVAHHAYKYAVEGSATRNADRTGSHSRYPAAREAGRCPRLSTFHAAFWGNRGQTQRPVSRTSHMSREGVAAFPPASLCPLPCLETLSVAAQTTEFCKDRLQHVFVSGASVVDQTAHCLRDIGQAILGCHLLHERHHIFFELNGIDSFIFWHHVPPYRRLSPFLVGEKTQLFYCWKVCRRKPRHYKGPKACTVSHHAASFTL